MAIDLPPSRPSAPPDDADAEALFEEAREVERARRRRKLAGASVVAGIALALGVGFGVGGGGGGGGGGAALARHASGGAGAVHPRPEQVQTLTSEIVSGSSSICMNAAQAATPGDPPPGQCVIELPNRQQYQCPIAVENRFSGEIGDVATDRACHRVKPPTLPVSWRPSVRRMHAVSACLTHAGLSAGGNALPPAAEREYPGSPVASILIAGTAITPARAALAARPKTTRPAFVNFYLTTAQARRAYNTTLPTVSKEGLGLAVRGRVLYTWNSQPAREAATERSCLTAA